MSGVRRTEDFHSIKTRGIVFQQADGTFPPLGAVLACTDNRGHAQPTLDLRVNSIVCTGNISAAFVGSGSLPVPSVNVTNLTVEHLSAGTIDVSSIMFSNSALPVTLLHPNATSTTQLIQSYNNLILYFNKIGLVTIPTLTITRVLAVTDDQKLLITTSKANTWISLTAAQLTGFPSLVSGIIWANSLWFAIGNNPSSTIVYTTDLSLNQWTAAAPMTPYVFDGSGSDIVWNGQIFVATFKNTTNSIWTSSDGITWFPAVTMPPISVINRVIWNGTVWMVLGRDASGGVLYTSIDGDNWINPCNQNVPRIDTILDAAYDGLKWVICGTSSSGNTVKYSYGDITAWEWVDSSGGIFNNTAASIAWNGNIFVSVGNDTDPSGNIPVIYSQDGLLWQRVDVSGLIGSELADWDYTFNIGTSVMWVINRFIAVGRRFNNTNQEIMVPIYSENGANWILGISSLEDPPYLGNIATISHNYSIWDEQPGVPTEILCYSRP